MPDIFVVMLLAVATALAGYLLINRDRPEVRENWRRYTSILLTALFLVLIASGIDFMFSARPAGLALFALLVLVGAAVIWFNRSPG
jgi:hypothetical protein